MLDTKDLEVLQSMMEKVVDDRLDSRISQSEATILTQMDKRLDSRIAQSEEAILTEIDKRLDSRIAKSEAAMSSMMDKRIAKSEATMSSMIDKCIAKSENLVLEEMERTRQILEGKIQTVQNNLDTITE